MGTALPLIDSYAHEVLKERKHESRIRRQQQKIDALVSRAKTEIEKLEQKRKTEKKDQKPEANNTKPVSDENRRTDDGDPIGEKRKTLIREAKDQGDTKAMMKIAADPPEEIYRLWKMRTSVPHEPPKGIKKTKKKRR